MKQAKAKKGLISVVLSIVLMAVFMMPSFLTSEATINPDENVRVINAEKIVNTSADDVIDQFLEAFSDSECVVDPYREGVYVSTMFNPENGGELFEVSMSRVEAPIRDNEEPSDTDEPFEIKETVIFEVSRYDLLDDGKKVKVDDYSIYLFQDEDTGEYYLDYDGDLVSVADILDENLIDNCIAIADDVVVSVATIGVVLICFYTIVIYVAPAVGKTVYNMLSNFRSWMRSWIASRIAVRTVVTYNVEVFDKEYELERVDTAVIMDRFTVDYHLAVLVGYIPYISVESIDESTAVDILFSRVYILINDTKYLLNTYTLNAEDAERAAVKAGGGVATHHEPHIREGEKGVFFSHYHPGTKIKWGTPHSFYGAPTITL